MNYYISDLHLGHYNCIIKYDKRPFETVEENDDAIMTRWNKVVTNSDDVYLLGDISWYNPAITIDILHKLNGKKHLIVGNHDKPILRHNQDFQECFASMKSYYEIYDKSIERHIVLCHYPIMSFKSMQRDWIHFYGHVHNTEEWTRMERLQKDFKINFGKDFNAINVGCMMEYMNYTPKTARQICDDYIIWAKSFKK